MVDAPEKIWAGSSLGVSYWSLTQSNNGLIEYVRAETAERQLAERDADLARAREALQPFVEVVERAEEASAHYGGVHADDVPDEQQYGVLGITWGHLRAARFGTTGSMKKE